MWEQLEIDRYKYFQDLSSLTNVKLMLQIWIFHRKWEVKVEYSKETSNLTVVHSFYISNQDTKY